MLEVVLKNVWVRALGALLLLLLVAGAVYLMLPILTALLFSFLVAYILVPVVDAAERLRIPRMLVILALLLVMFVTAVTLPVYLITGVIREAEMFVTSARRGITEERMDRLLDDLPLRELVHYLGWAPGDEDDFNERAVILERIGAAIRENALYLARNYGMRVADISKQAGLSAAQLMTALGGWSLRIIAFLVNLSLFVLVSVYLLRDYDAFVHALRELAPPRHRARLDELARKINAQLRALLRGQVTVCVSLALMYGIGLHWAGAPFALPIALFGGAAAIVPYVGPMLTLTPAVLLTALFYGIGGNLYWVFGVFVIVQIIETYFLTPRVLGSRMGLNPVWVIVAFMVFSSALGFLGMVLAMPITAIIKVLAGEAHQYYRNSRFYREALFASPSSSPASADASTPQSSSSDTVA